MSPINCVLLKMANQDSKGLTGNQKGSPGFTKNIEAHWSFQSKNDPCTIFKGSNGLKSSKGLIGDHLKLSELTGAQFV